MLFKMCQLVWYDSSQNYMIPNDPMCRAYKMVFFLIHTFKKVLKKLNSRKIGKIRERIALEIFLPIFREFCIFNTFLKVYIKNCTFVLCLLHSEMSKTVFSKLLKKLNY